MTKAFSLIELMIVIGIIALVTAIAAPFYGNYINKTQASLGAQVLTDLNDQVMALYNEGLVSSGITTLTVEGTTYTDNTPISINYPPAVGATFYAPGDGIVASNEWMFCINVSGMYFSGYVSGLGGAYSRLCSKVVVNNGVFTTYCGSYNNSSSDIPSQYLPDECSLTNVSSY